MTPIFALSTVAMALLGVLVVVVLFILFWIGTFNTLVTLRNRYKNAFSQIDVQLKRRYDLIPNLVEDGQGVHEARARDARGGDQRPQSAVTASKSAATTPGDSAAMAGLDLAEAQLSGALGRLFALAESLSRPQGQPEHAGPSGRADLDREQGRVRPPGVQRRGHLATTPRSRSSRTTLDRGDGRVRPGPALRDRIAQGARGAPGGVLIGVSACVTGWHRLPRDPSRAVRGRLRMDFFQNQETARRKTGLLIVYFLLAVVLIILTVLRGDRGGVAFG